MPEVELPLSFVKLSSRVIIIGAVSVAKVIFECACIDISVCVKKFTLEWSGVIKITAFEPFSAREEKWKIWLHLNVALNLNI